MTTLLASRLGKALFSFLIGLFVLVVLPVVWGFIRKSQGLPMFGSPTLAQLEDPSYKPGLVGMKKVDDGGGPA